MTLPAWTRRFLPATKRDLDDCRTAIIDAIMGNPQLRATVTRLNESNARLAAALHKASGNPPAEPKTDNK